MIKEVLNKMRYKFFLLKKTIPYTEDYLNQVYKIYLNHNKVITYRDGYPVFSLSTPALYSKPMANMFARSIFSSIQNRKIPNLMSFAVNKDCNANCSHCSFHKLKTVSKKQLTTDQAKNVIRDAQKLGVSVINFVGGEPLMRKDINQIIKAVDKKLSTTVMFTNGYFLKENAKQLRKSGLDSVYVSIDSSSKEIHDKKRGKDGLYEKAINGLKESLKQGLTVGISTCISEEDFDKGELGKVIDLAKKMKIHEVLVFDTMPVGKLEGCKNFYDKNWQKRLITYSEKINLNKNYPGLLIYSYATSYMSTGCAGGTSYFYVSPYGDVSPCDFNHSSVGNVLDNDLHLLWDKLNSDPIYNKSGWNGCRTREQKD